MELLDILNGVMEKAEENIGRKPEDYEKDGLLYCGKCDTPKQIELEIFGKTIKPYCLCACEIARRAEEEQAERDQVWKAYIERLRAECFPDSDMSEWRFENDDHANERLSVACRRYAEKFGDIKKGLLLFGGVGTGKTFMAACIANYLIDNGERCLVTSFARLANELNKSWDGKQDALDRLNDYKLLVIDDLAAERDTEYMNEIVQSVIDTRYRSGKPVIITTNLTSDELKHPSDIKKQRLYSRLFEMCIPIEVNGSDRRTKKLKETYNDYAELLGLKGDQNG